MGGPTPPAKCALLRKQRLRPFVCREICALRSGKAALPPRSCSGGQWCCGGAEESCCGDPCYCDRLACARRSTLARLTLGVVSRVRLSAVPSAGGLRHGNGFLGRIREDSAALNRALAQCATTANCALLVALALSAIVRPATAAGDVGRRFKAAGESSARASMTRGAVTIAGQRVAYTATAGILRVKNSKGQPYVGMSYISYVKRGERDPTRRPITFFYNGGPGSSSVWLNMLAYGPVRIVVGDGGTAPVAPYRLADNGDSLLDATDEVFVDAPGTGFGRLITKANGGVGTPDLVYGIDQDARTFARFIVQYLNQTGRWNSPKFLYGESYGTTRDAVLAYDLTREGVNLNGVVFQSAAINWNIVLQFASAEPGVSLAYATGLPSEAAIAWYHHVIPDRPSSLHSFLKVVEQFAMGPYMSALDAGNTLAPDTEQAIAQQLHDYIGIPVSYILRADLRVDAGQFRHELLIDRGLVTGRLDARFTGPDFNRTASVGENAPLMNAITPPVVALFNNYVRRTLHFGNGLQYKVSANIGRFWKNVHRDPGMPGGGMPMTFIVNVMPDIADAMKLNPSMNVLVTGGYFDLGTPFFAAKYSFEHLRIPRSLQKRITYHFFESGHMVYVTPAAHRAIHAVTASFIRNSSK